MFHWESAEAPAPPAAFEGDEDPTAYTRENQVRDLIGRLQQNMKKSHEYLCETLQNESRKRLQGESKVLRESQQSIMAVQGAD
jgi:hypothetical protein